MKYFLCETNFRVGRWPGGLRVRVELRVPLAPETAVPEVTTASRAAHCLRGAVCLKMPCRRAGRNAPARACAGWRRGRLWGERKARLNMLARHAAFSRSAVGKRVQLFPLISDLSTPNQTLVHRR